MRSLLLIAALLVTATTARGEIAWRPNLKTAHDEATATGKLILVHFYADNCVWCDRLEQGAFQDPSLATAIEANFVPVKINGSRETKFAAAFSVSRFPTDVIVASDGAVLSHTVSPQDPSRYLAMLNGPEVVARIASAARPAGPTANSISPAATASTAPAATQAPTQSAPAQSAPAQPAPAQTVANQSPADWQQNPSAVAAGVHSPPAATRSNPQVAGPGPEAGGFAMPPGIASGNFDMGSYQGTPAIPVGLRGASSAAPAAQELPPEALDGYCPVTMIHETRWVQGNPKHGIIHLGQLYLFASSEAQQKFLAAPEKYTPVLNGIDVVKFFEERKIVPGSREWGFTDPVYGRMFFFADEASMNHFYDHHQQYVEPAIELTRRAAADANRR